MIQAISVQFQGKSAPKASKNVHRVDPYLEDPLPTVTEGLIGIPKSRDVFQLSRRPQQIAGTKHGL